MVSELWFSRLGGQLWAAAVEDGRIVEIHHEWPADNAAPLGSIYLARIQRIVPQLEAAFVSLGTGFEGYLEADDLVGEGSPTEKLAALNAGQGLVVQVRREAHAAKKARVTAKLDLAGTYMTLRPHGSGVAVSRRIQNESERRRLADWARSSGGRVLLRTAAEGVREPQLREELEVLTGRVERLTRAAREATAPCRLESGPGVVPHLIRDYAGRELQRVVVETDSDFALVGETLGSNASIRRHDGPAPLIHAAGIWKTAQQALNPRLNLPSGATLAIEPTEALWAIDVNAATVRGPGGSVPSSAAINAEAAKRIAAEIRLRDVAGTILIDFLDQTGDAERDVVADCLRRALRSDRRYLRISGWTPLGLCEIARRRLGPGLLERLGEPNRPTPWGRAAQILASMAEEPVPKHGRVVTVDASTAAALSASIEASEAPLELSVEISDR
jgi:Rne/Rng family ribonuclease